MTPRITVSQSALLGNLQALRARTSPGTSIAPVVKANAWGHGRDLVARLLAPHVDVLALATPEDALAISPLADGRVLCLGPTYGFELRELLHARVEVTVANDLGIRELGRGDRAHLVVDTGLHRLGATPAEAPGLLEAIRKTGATVAGVFCHVAGADRGEWRCVEDEIALLRAVAAGAPIHTGGSSLIIERPDLVGDLARPGVAVYGFHPAPRQVDLIELTPALSLLAPVVELREVPAGTRIGYSGVELQRRTTVATIAIGVAHGIDPRLVDVGAGVRVSGHSAAILTPPMLDYTLVDVTDGPTVNIGDDALVMGGPTESSHSISSVASKLGSSAEHVVTGLSTSISRELTA
ncbi:alanine racemase [Pedococcus sp. P5_B7]